MKLLEHADIGTFLHLQWLWLLATPIPNYLFSNAVLEGVILPALISTGLLLKYWRQVKDQQIISGFLFFAVTMGLFKQYLGNTGLHLFTRCFVIWPVRVLLLGDRFAWPLAYKGALDRVILTANVNAPGKCNVAFLRSHGVQVRTMPKSPVYMHAKMIVGDS